MKTLTNILNYDIKKEAIQEDFVIVEFENKNNFFKINSKYLDIEDINALSFAYTGGKKAYALMYKDDFYNLRYCDDLKNITYKKIDINHIYNNIILRLFLYSLTNYSSEEAYSNLTGKFYKIIDDITKNRNKIKALDFSIDNRDMMTLNVSATSFIRNKDKYTKEPLYTYSGNNKTLKRIFNPNDSICYKKGNEEGKRTTYPFIKIGDGSGRAKELLHLVDLFNEKFSKYVKIELNEFEIEKKIDPSKIKIQEKTLDLIKNFKINVVSLISDLKYEDEINDFIKYLKSIGLKVTNSKKKAKDKLNIILIHDVDYYEKHKLSDPHQEIDKTCVFQHIIIDNLAKFYQTMDSKISPQLITVFKELLIKNDILNKCNNFSFINWEDYKFKDKYTFILRTNDNLYKMVIEPSGSYEIFVEEINLFNAYENDKIHQVFINNNEIKLMIIDDFGNINAIERTKIITLPYKEAIAGKVCRKKQVKNELYPGLCDINLYKIHNEYYYNVGQTLPNISKQIQNASHLYKVNLINDSKSFIEDVINLMSVSFVKYNESTVLPFPIKYLREYVNIYGI